VRACVLCVLCVVVVLLSLHLHLLHTRSGYYLRLKFDKRNYYLLLFFSRLLIERQLNSTQELLKEEVNLL